MIGAWGTGPREVGNTQHANVLQGLGPEGLDLKVSRVTLELAKVELGDT